MRLLRRLAMPGLLLLITVAFFWKLVLTGQFTWMNQPDTVNQILPWFQFEASEWHAGRFPLWHPHNLAGDPLLGRMEPGGAYPLNWILFNLPLRDGRIPRAALHWYFVLIHYMGALFCYWLCRDLKRTRGAALLAGAAFGLGGWMGTTDWPQMLNGAVWAPLVFLFFLRAMRGERPVRNAALAGTFLGVSFLSGHHQIPLIVTLTLAFAWLYYALRGVLPRRQIALAAAVFGVQVFLAGALQILPAYEYGRLAVRFVGSQNPVFWGQKVPYIVHGTYSLYPLSVLGIIFPGIHRTVDPFIGLVMTCLALVAIYAAWREPMVRFFGAIALGALLFSLGGYSVFHGVLYSVVPMIDKARSPAMAIFLVHLGMVVLAAYGLDAYRDAATRESVWSRRLVRTLVALGALCYFALLVLTRFRAQQEAEYEQVALTALAALLLAWLLHSWKRGAVALAFLLMLFEIGNVTGANYFHREQPGGPIHALEENADIVRYLKSLPEPVRLEVYEEQGPINFGDWHGVDQFRGASSELDSVAYVEAAPRHRQLFALNYYLGTHPLRSHQTEVFRGQSGLNLYRNPDAMPRVWTVHAAQSIRGKPEILALLRDDSFDLRRRTFLWGSPPQLESCEGDDARLVSYEPNRVAIEADMRCRGMVILADTLFPGWQATVDGRPAPICQAYTVVRGVVADAGRHRIEMRYRPMPVYLGAVGTLAGILGALVWAGIKTR